MEFLPVNRREMAERGWQQADFILVTGDAYVDHPSFGTALIGRLLEHFGYRVAVLAQPDWHSPDAFRALGRPRLAYLINGGNVDSMVNHYSVFRHRRRRDVYSPGGQNGRRPDRAVIVYANMARAAWHDVPVVIGGLEASLRRLAHYDYWDDRVRRSILLDSGADLLVYGMGERALLEIAEALDAGLPVRDITWIRGTCVRQRQLPPGEVTVLPDYAAVRDDRRQYAESFRLQYRSHDSLTAATLAERYDDKTWVIQNPPQPPLEQMELDDLYALPFMRRWHPQYDGEGGVPALQEVRFSITANRGCFGGCAFCALTYHQGRQVRSRSRASIVREAELLTQMPDFKGYIHDIGGPTANFTAPACTQQLERGVCADRDCLWPRPCRQLRVDHSEYLETLRAVRALPGVKKVFIRSGIRYDYVMADRDESFLRELCAHHVSGTLKVAPEHVAPGVLACMRKPPQEVFARFVRRYREINRELGKEQYLIPYFISSHPGCTLDDAVDLALYLARSGFVPDQVQDFYPTPGTLSTCMYHTGIDPLSGRPVYVPRSRQEKRMQRALLHFHKRENRSLVREALRRTGREEAADELFQRTRRSRRTD
ncbi:MAG: YgiQ family radical SAM protein [Anaerovoracaceae bacterium]|jgi:uncharacterized radical SAM protein YgiQ